MKIGMIGAGKMGGNMARRWQRGGVEVLVFDRSEAARAALKGIDGIRLFGTLPELVAALPARRLLWLMLPTGGPTDQVIDELRSLLDRGDLVVDGANAHYRASQQHGELLAQSGIGFADAGVSGGIWGLEAGYGLMLGGDPETIQRIMPFARILAPSAGKGLVHCGPVGAGHFAKMVHNGIEYGLMQAYAEGFALMREHPDFDLDLAAIAGNWLQGSVVRSWLLELARDALAGDPGLAGVAPVVADSGEGRWAAREAIERGVPAPVITTALMQRFASQGRDEFAARVLATLRNRFGGHAIPRE